MELIVFCQCGCPLVVAGYREGSLLPLNFFDETPQPDLSSSGYWGTTTLSGSRSWSRNSWSCGSRASNGRDLASNCVLRPHLEELCPLTSEERSCGVEDGLDCGVSYD